MTTTQRETVAPGRATAPADAPRQSRARYPDAEGYVERDGVRLFYELYGSGPETVLLLPTWSIVPSRFWKAQIPYLARHCRVLSFDGRGNGRSDRPVGAEAYSTGEFAADTLAVMDATATECAALISASCGAQWATILAADYPARVSRVVYIAPAVRLAPGHSEREEHHFEGRLDTTEGWAKYNSRYWSENYLDFVHFFAAKCFTEPHSTKQIEDFIGWALQTSPETLADTVRGMGVPRDEAFIDTCARVRCPTLVIHADRDAVRPHAQGRALADATAGQLVTLEDGGHLPHCRDPVKLNLLLRDFTCPPAPTPRWRRARTRPKRALYISSPIGLGHARRDLAIAGELRKLHPELEIDWLAQHPVTVVLAAEGERIHPASTELANESAHFQAQASEHDLHAFEALRRMDEILIANFMVFDDLVRDEQYDLWIGDEAWELDYFLHENPECKTAPYVWLSDFVGWLPMPEHGAREALLTADLNAEMIEQRARFPRVRDRSIFIGDPDDIVDERFGPGMQRIRDWTEQQFSFSGYVTGFDASTVSDRAALRADLGYGEKEQVCIATVGGSGTGEALLQRVIASLPEAKQLVPKLRMIVVAGPRIDLDAIPAADGLEIRPYVHELYRHLAACDLGIVQGGLTTTMELTTARRPFIYFPLRGHFEQQFHVEHRLRRYGAGRRMDFESSPPEAIAVAIAEEIGREVNPRPVAPDAAARAAALIGEVL